MSTRDENLKALRSAVKNVSDAQYEKHRHGYLCPSCGEPMVERAHLISGTPFFGCSQYPDCEGTREADGECAEEIGVMPRSVWGDEDDPPLHDWGDF